MSQANLADVQNLSEFDNNYSNENLNKPLVNIPVFVHQKQLASDPERLESVRAGFKAPLLMRINRTLQVALIILSVIAVVAYSIDVIMSRNLTIAQEKARRLSEQNCELSAKLLKAISFQDIQESVLGHSARQSNLKVPDEVLIAAEIPSVKYKAPLPAKHHLPLMAGY